MFYLVAFALQRGPDHLGFDNREIVSEEPIRSLEQLNHLLLELLQNEKGKQSLPSGTVVKVISFQSFED